MQPANIGIVTTASLPWLTGTSIVPLFQAVYLKKRGFQTTLYLPWLPPDQQHHCFQDQKFDSAEGQQAYILDWLPEELREFCPEIRFYPAKYYAFIESIGPLVDLDQLIGDHQTIILEEPEHLFASHPWSRIKNHRAEVIGVVMTNYQYYHSQHIPSFLARWYQYYSRFLMQRMCHRIVALAEVHKDVCSLPICRVLPLTAVDPRIFKTPPPTRTSRAYFMGKLIPEKGIEELFRNLHAAGVDQVDLYGYGQTEWVSQTAARYGLRPDFKGLSNRPWQDLPGYRIFINCSRSEYLCTTTANALAMRQWAIVPNHPSNRFYFQFRNCLVYDSLDEFVKQFNHALAGEPESDPLASELSWEAATDRLVKIIGHSDEP